MAIVPQLFAQAGDVHVDPEFQEVLHAVRPVIGWPQGGGNGIDKNALPILQQ